MHVDPISADGPRRSGDEPPRALDFERQLRLALDDVARRAAPGRVHVLTDERLAAGEGAGLLLQVDDYDVRVVLLDCPDGHPCLSPQLLPRYRAILGEHPNTIALVLVWATGELPSVPLSVRRIAALFDVPERAPERTRALASRAKPLAEVLADLFSLQAGDWSAQLAPARGPAEPSFDVRREFAAALPDAVARERARSYRDPERKRAADDFPLADELRVLLEALDDALAGSPVDELVGRLTRAPRRDAR
jgi:hypothetical protein